jgi:hypothetical protein
MFWHQHPGQPQCGFYLLFLFLTPRLARVFPIDYSSDPVNFTGEKAIMQKYEIVDDRRRMQDHPDSEQAMQCFPVVL